MEERRVSLGGVNDADSNDASDADVADVRAADVSETRSGQTQFRHQELSEVQIAYLVQNTQTVLSRHKGGPEANSRRTSVAKRVALFLQPTLMRTLGNSRPDVPIRNRGTCQSRSHWPGHAASQCHAAPFEFRAILERRLGPKAREQI